MRKRTQKQLFDFLQGAQPHFVCAFATNFLLYPELYYISRSFVTQEKCRWNIGKILRTIFVRESISIHHDFYATFYHAGMRNFDTEHPIVAALRSFFLKLLQSKLHGRFDQLFVVHQATAHQIFDVFANISDHIGGTYPHDDQ